MIHHIQYNKTEYQNNQLKDCSYQHKDEEEEEHRLVLLNPPLPPHPSRDKVIIDMPNICKPRAWSL